MASDNIRLMCPNLKCRAILSVPGSAQGKNVRCRNCGTKIMVPSTAPASVPAAAAATARNESDDAAA